MDFEEKFKQFMFGLNPIQTGWTFVTSANGALAVKTPIVNVGANATGGAIWIKNEADGSTHSLKYGGVGGSVGVSLVPTPVDFAFSIPQFPSAGRIYKLPFAHPLLTQQSFRAVGRPLIENHEWNSILYFLAFILIGLLDLKFKKEKG